MKVKTFYLVVLVIIGLLLAACSSRSEKIAFDKVCNPENKNKVVAVEGYIHAGDSISCSEQRAGAFVDLRFPKIQNQKKI